MLEVAAETGVVVSLAKRRMSTVGRRMDGDGRI